MERLGKLPLSPEEKAQIFVLLSAEQLAKEMPDFLDNEAVAASLRIKFLARARLGKLASLSTEEKDLILSLASDEHLQKLMPSSLSDEVVEASLRTQVLGVSPARRRLGKLAGLSTEEKGLILSLASDEQLQKLMPSSLSDELVEASLRTQVLGLSPARRRLGKLAALSEDEKGLISVLATDEQLQKLMQSSLSDEAVVILEPLAPVSEEQVAALVASVPPFPLGGGDQPTREALASYLGSFECLKGLVPVVTLPKGLHQSCFFKSASSLAVIVSAALEDPKVGSGEIVANSRMLIFFKLFDYLMKFSDVRSRLNYRFSMDQVETASSATSTQTARCGKRKRPDYLFESGDTLLMIGEGKDTERDWTVAINEITAKLNKVPDWVYGNVRFLLMPRCSSL